MADREVTNTGKDGDGDITKLCNPATDWVSVSKATVIADIEKGNHTYHVIGPSDRRTEIQVVPGPSGKYLRTKADGSVGNNLDELPDC